MRGMEITCCNLHEYCNIHVAREYRDLSARGKRDETVIDELIYR